MLKYYNYVIYHKKCPDGFAGFFILHKAKKIDKNAIIFPDVPGAKVVPSNIDNKDVIIIDVAYKANIVREIIMRAKSLLFIDHHITIHEEIKELQNQFSDKFRYIFNNNKSGATLTWDFLYPKKKHPYFIDLIEDNDIGRWKMPNIKNFMTGFSVNYDLKLTFDNIKKFNSLLNKSTINKLINKGKIYNEYKSYLTTENASRYSVKKFPSNLIYKKFNNFFSKPGQYKVAVYCGSSCPGPSDLAEKILKESDCDFFIAWVLNFDRNEYILTFRSININVGEIAKLFNGGGHTYAAACSFKIDKYNINDIFM